MENITTEIFETFVSAGILDSKGREVGYIVGLRVYEGVPCA